MARSTRGELGACAQRGPSNSNRRTVCRRCGTNRQVIISWLALRIELQSGEWWNFYLRWNCQC